MELSAQHQQHNPRSNQRKNTFPPQVPIHQLFKLLNIKSQKTSHCKHENGCLESVCQSFSDSFVLGYCIKTGISLLFGLKSVFKKPSNILSILFSKDGLSFSMFLASFSSIFKAVICVARRKFGQTKIASAIAGFVAGVLSILFLQQKTRQNLALFLLTRAFDTIYNSLINKGYIPKWKYDYVLLYSLMMTITGYCYGNEPGCMTPQMNKFYLSFTNENVNDLQMRQIWIQRKNNELEKLGIPRQNPLDYMPRLKKYYESLK